jgi:hypothetical protein
LLYPNVQATVEADCALVKKNFIVLLQRADDIVFAERPIAAGWDIALTGRSQIGLHSHDLSRPCTCAKSPEALSTLAESFKKNWRNRSLNSVQLKEFNQVSKLIDFGVFSASHSFQRF